MEEIKTEEKGRTAELEQVEINMSIWKGTKIIGADNIFNMVDFNQLVANKEAEKPIEAVDFRK
jgi:hypothetical protein